MAIIVGPHTADRTVKTGAGKLRGFSLIAGITNPILVLRDSVDATGAVIGKCTIPKGEKSFSMLFPTPVSFSSGLHADIFGTAAAYFVTYE